MNQHTTSGAWNRLREQSQGSSIPISRLMPMKRMIACLFWAPEVYQA